MIMKQGERTTSRTEIYRLAYNTDFPPFSVCENEKPRGLGIEILNAAMNSVELGVEFVPSSLTEIQDLMIDGRVDGIALWAVTPERERRFDFSEPVIRTGGAIFQRASDPPALDLADYEGKRVVTPPKGPLFLYIIRNFPGVQIVEARDYPESLAAVLRGDAEAAALNIHVAPVIANEKYPGKFRVPDRVLLEMPLAVAALKGKKRAMLKKINEGLKKAGHAPAL